MRRAPDATTLFLLILLMSAALMQSSAQPAVAAPRSRDATADEVIRRSLDAMGGSKSWSSVHAIQLRASLKRDAAKSLESSVLTAWAAGSLRSRREYVNDDHAVALIHDPNRGTFLQDMRSTKREFKQVRQQHDALPEELPAVSFSIALRDPDWTIAILAPDRFHTERRVAISRMLAGRRDKGTEQDWTFDDATGLPTTVTTYSPTLSHTSVYVETTTTFLEFSSMNGLKIPAKTEVRHDRSRPEVVTYSTPVLNPALDKKTFLIDESEMR